MTDSQSQDTNQGHHSGEPAAAVTLSALRSEHLPALKRLFTAAGIACHCRWWHFAGDKNAWLDRCANHPEQNWQEFLTAASPATGAPGADSQRPFGMTEETSGFVASVAGEVVGWLKFTPARAIPKLYEQRLYRNLPCFAADREGVYTVGCFVVHPDWRGRNFPGELLDLAVRTARAAGARAVEAFPRRAEQLSPAEKWLGPATVFDRLGFRQVGGFNPYPVLRLDLAQNPALGREQ